MKLKGAKTGSSCGGLWSVETNSRLDMCVTALLPHGAIMMMMMMTITGVAFPVCVYCSFDFFQFSDNTDLG